MTSRALTASRSGAGACLRPASGARRTRRWQEWTDSRCRVTSRRRPGFTSAILRPPVTLDGGCTLRRPVRPRFRSRSHSRRSLSLVTLRRDRVTQAGDRFAMKVVPGSPTALIVIWDCSATSFGVRCDPALPRPSTADRREPGSESRSSRWARIGPLMIPVKPYVVDAEVTLVRRSLGEDSRDRHLLRRPSVGARR